MTLIDVMNYTITVYLANRKMQTLARCKKTL